MSNKNQQTVISYDDEDKGFLLEVPTITNSEVRKNYVETIQKSGHVVRTKPGIVEERIEHGIMTEVQKRTSQIDRKLFEKKALEEVDKKLIELNLVAEDGRLLIPEENRTIAIVQATRALLKKEISNRYKFTKAQLMKISRQSSSNMQYLDKVLSNMRSKKNYIIEEKVVSDDFQTIRVERLSLSFFTAFGISSEEKNNSTSSMAITVADEESLRKVSLREMKDTDELIIEHDTNYIPYIVRPTQTNYHEGHIRIENSIFYSFDSEYTAPMYKIAEQWKDNWVRNIFTMIPLQKRFGSKYGVKKKLNPKYDKNNPDMTPADRYLKNIYNHYIYEVDKNDQYIYDDDYLKEFKFFKKLVLQKAINELEVKTNYRIRIIEIREGGHPLYSYNCSLLDLIKKGKAIYTESVNTVVIGSPRGQLKFIQFEITEKKPQKVKSIVNLKSPSYYAAIRLQLDKIDNKKETVVNLDKYAKSLKKNFPENFNPILEIETYEDLLEKVEKNYLAILELRKLLRLGLKKLSSIVYCPKYMLAYDKASKNTGLQKYADRLGDDAIECLEVIYSDNPDLRDIDLDSIGEKKIEDFLPFAFSCDGEKFASITSKNYIEYSMEIHKAIKEKRRKRFKSFESMHKKREFIYTFIDESIL